MIRSAAEEPYLPVAGLAASCVVAPDLDIPCTALERAPEHMSVAEALG
jgi:hypothetical protein